MSKIYKDAKSALADILQDNQTIALGGFGICGTARSLVQEVQNSNIQNITCVCLTGGTDTENVGVLLQNKQIKKIISSYVGENKLLEQQYANKEIEIEFTPQGTLAEKLRAAGAGIPAFYTKTGVGTQVEEGKETKEFNGKKYLLEESISPDIGLVKAYIADKAGNLIFRKTAKNSNPEVAMASKITVVEVEKLVEIGELDPENIHLPGIFVQRIIVDANPEKPIEFLTVKEQK